MNSNRTELLVSRLQNSIHKDNFQETCEEVVEQLEDGHDGRDAIGPILRLMELHEDVDFGMPGPLVHFLEKYYRSGYEELLLESVKQRPTPHTLWMLNRIVNGTSRINGKKISTWK